MIPFPGWDFFPDEDVHDLDEDVHDLDAAARERTLPLTHSVPARVPTDALPLSGGRHRVPVTLLMGGMDADEVEHEVDQWGAYGEEFRAIADASVVKIGSGHWPQFSQPQRLAELIVDAVATTR
ncbi:hypothetical protein AB0269_04240 [Microbacterium sp. NPDC077644]|uniref:hypothetical protein n=1 Tax=Microbacterium sp. NPDC077644 TaxID=3155055 RepID=UPI0034504BA7